MDIYIYIMVDERLMVIYNHFGVDIIWNVQKTYSKKQMNMVELLIFLAHCFVRAVDVPSYRYPLVN